MKKPISILVSVLLFLFSQGSSSRVIAQEQRSCVRKENERRVLNSSGSCPSTWKRLAILQLSFCVPDGFAVEHNAKGMEQGRFQYKNDVLKFSIDYSESALHPTVERKLSSYRENVILSPPIKFWLWSIENSQGYRYVNGLNVWDDKTSRYIAGLFLLSNTAEGPKLAPRVFDTLCYNPD